MRSRIKKKSARFQIIRYGVRRLIQYQNDYNNIMTTMCNEENNDIENSNKLKELTTDSTSKYKMSDTKFKSVDEMINYLSEKLGEEVGMYTVQYVSYHKFKFHIHIKFKEESIPLGTILVENTGCVYVTHTISRNFRAYHLCYINATHNINLLYQFVVDREDGRAHYIN